MAENDIALNLDVNMAGGAKSLADLKKEFKSLQAELSATKEGTVEYQRALERLGAVKDDMGDLRDTINALNPEGKVQAFTNVASKLAAGFSAAQGAAALFGSESEELQKSLIKVQAAMAFAQGIKELSGLTDAFKVLGTVIKANPIFALAAVFLAVGAAVAKFGFELYESSKASSKMSDELERNKKITASINDTLETKIRLLKGVKGSEEEILKIQEKQLLNNIELQKQELRLALLKQEEKKKEFNLETFLFALTGQTKAAKVSQLVAESKGIEDVNKALTALKDLEISLANNRTEQHNLTIEQKEKETDAYKKAAEERKRLLDKENEENQKRLDNYLEQETQKALIDEQQRQFKKEEEDKIRFANQESDVLATQLEQDMLDEMVESNRQAEEKKRAEKQKTFDTSIELTKQSLAATQALTDLFFAHQLRMARGNAEKEKELKKKQFNVNKAFGIANSIIDGVQAIQKALNNPYPLNIILAVLTGILATANTVKIATTKFEDGGTGGSAGDIGSVGATASAPTVQQPNNTVTQISDTGEVDKAKEQGPQKVFVLETDISDSNKRVANIEETAQIK